MELACAFFVQPDILLLDEPTNHLDFAATEWLQQALCDYPKTVIVVSHDRDFLNKVTTDIIHIEKKQLHYYKGDYLCFQLTRENEQRRRTKERYAQKKKISELKTFINKHEKTIGFESVVQAKLKQLALERRDLEDDDELPGSRCGYISSSSSASKGYPEDEEGKKAFRFSFFYPDPLPNPSGLVRILDMSFRWGLTLP